MDAILQSKNYTVVKMDDINKYISESDAEMDRRAVAAVNAAIEKAKVCGKPIARYDIEEKRVYMEYPDGHREYADEQ